MARRTREPRLPTHPNYRGYLSEHVEHIRMMHLGGADTRTIAEELYRLLARAQPRRIICPKDAARPARQQFAPDDLARVAAARAAHPPHPPAALAAAVVTKASASRRRRRLENRGRPAGSYKSLLKDDPQRFSIAAWLTLEPVCGPHIAARAATVWFEEKTPITIQDIEGLLVMIGADYAAPGTGDLTDHARKLAAKARLVTSRATPREFEWLIVSSGALLALMKFVLEGNLVGIDRTLELLQRAGWREVLDHTSRRLVPALRAHFPPYEGSLSGSARRLLATLRARKKSGRKSEIGTIG